MDLTSGAGPERLGAAAKEVEEDQRHSDIVWEDAVMTTIGLIGAGHIGSQIARLSVANGYKVVISNSRGTGDFIRACRGTRT